MYAIRAARPDDAEAIVGLLRATYADTYPFANFYDPEEVRRKQREGTLISLVAEDCSSSQVVGHYGLKRPPGHYAAEAGLAMVSEAHRGSRLLDRMRQGLEELALVMGLLGLYGTPVTSHSYSQKAYDRRHNTPTGLLLGSGEVSMAGFHERRTEHLMLYFKYLQPPPLQEMLVPAELQPLAQSIYADLGAPLRFVEPSGVDLGLSLGEFGAGKPLLTFPGSQALPETIESVAYLDLPLKVDGWGALYAQARQQGYRFAGLLPMRPHGDRLWLQRYVGNLDEVRPAINHPLGRRIWDFIRG